MNVREDGLRAQKPRTLKGGGLKKKLDEGGTKNVPASQWKVRETAKREDRTKRW